MCFKINALAFYPRKPNRAWNSSNYSGPSMPHLVYILHMQTYGYKDPHAGAVIPKPGEDERENIIHKSRNRHFQISKAKDVLIRAAVSCIPTRGWAWYLTELLQQHVVGVCLFPHSIVQEIC